MSTKDKTDSSERNTENKDQKTNDQGLFGRISGKKERGESGRDQTTTSLDKQNGVDEESHMLNLQVSSHLALC